MVKALTEKMKNSREESDQKVRNIGTSLRSDSVLVRTCKILVRNSKLARISEEFCKICDSCNLGLSIVVMTRKLFRST